MQSSTETSNRNLNGLNVNYIPYDTNSNFSAIPETNQIFQSTPIQPPTTSSFYQSPLFTSLFPVASPQRCILGGFSIKWVAGTTVSCCYGCGMGIVNPPMLPEEEFCVVHRDLRYCNDPVTGLPKVTPKPVNVHFHP